MRKQTNNKPPPKLYINTDTKIETLHIWLIAIICCYLLHPFWKNWWSLHPDWLSARWFIYRLNNILVWRCEGRRNKLGDKLQQQITVCTCRATSHRITLQWHITVTNPFKRLSQQQNFVTATSPTNSVWFDFLRHAAATKFCYRDKDFHNNSPIHTKWFVTVMCRCDTLLQLVV